jgi:DNA-binding winged helix-turn-helix (wHTH) protein/Tfp pilus assembly protein PilF
VTEWQCTSPYLLMTSQVLDSIEVKYLGNRNKSRKAFAVGAVAVAETKPLSPSGILRFGVFQLNLGARELRKHGVRVRLPGQPFSLLSLLLEKPGEIVTREEMRQRLWASDTFVDFEHSLNSAIKKLRGALGDSPENSRYIETVPRMGYRFIAPVEEILAAGKSAFTTSAAIGTEGPAEQRVTRHRSWMTLLGVSAILVTIVSSTFVWLRFRKHSRAQDKNAGEIHSAGKGPAAASSDSQPALNSKSAEARDLYFKGLYYWNKRNASAFQQAIGYFQQAIEIDPNYAPAYVGLANSYTLLTAYSTSSGALYISQARAAALRALEIDEKSPEAHTAMALILQNYDWNWQGSEREYRRAIDLNPNNVTAHHWYAEHLMWLGRFDEALAESERARQLDPLSLIIAADNGAILYFSRQYDRAIEQFRKVLEKDPSFGRAGIVIYAYVEKGMFSEALAQVEVSPHHVYGEGPWYWSTLAYIYGRAGQKERARRELEKLEPLNHRQQADPVSMMWAHLGLEDKNEALADLEKAYSDHFSVMSTLKVDPALDPLRSDPRFQDLLRRVGLADSATGNVSQNPKASSNGNPQ